MQMKKQLKRILAFVMAFTFIVSTQVHAADGESSALMDIKSDGYEIQIADSASITYTGKEVKPAIKVVRTDESKEETVLDENKYETAYSDNVNAGTAKVTVKGKENEGVTAELTKEFTISPASSSLRITATIFCCASSTSFIRTGPIKSISSLIIAARRFDRFL